jgi:hypothetical protein
VNGGYYGGTVIPPSQSAYDIRPVTMCVYDSYRSRRTETSDEAILSQVALGRNGKTNHLDATALKRRQKARSLVRGRQCGRDYYPMPRTALRQSQRRDNRLQPPYRSGGQQMQDSERCGQCGRVGRVRSRSKCRPLVETAQPAPALLSEARLMLDSQCVLFRAASLRVSLTHVRRTITPS